jgi:hypothetical protein
MIELTTNSPGIEFIRNEMDWDTHDAWGSVQAPRFELAGAWWVHTGEYIEGFRTGSGYRMNSTAKRLNGAMNAGIITREDVDYWFRVLNRMRDLVIAAGREY